MRYQKLVVLMLTVPLSLFGFIAMATSEAYNSKTKRPVSYHLLVGKKVSARGGTISCRLRVENTSDVLQFVFRPRGEDVSLNVKGLDKRRYSVSFEERGFEPLAKLKIPLRPTCAIEMKLAKIMIKGSKELLIPQGIYLVTTSWKRPGFPDVKAGKFEVVEKYTPDTNGLQPSNNEYPLTVVLEPASKVYHLGNPIMLVVRLQNDGPMPIQIMSLLNRHKDFFRFETRHATSHEKIGKPLHIAAAIDPDVVSGWIILLPGESLSVAIDAHDEFTTPGQYRTAVTYYRSRILLYPPSGKPYYTKQHSWSSKEVDLVILQNPNLKKSK